ncbi:hypothetical protein RR42_m3083 [Cupriavidus basilensis]|uniref:Uncharacterized protein n=1 Tax=Cupriavidus basilensis TaxID=68895 RepID=A0A0C4YBZ8_9BURK|nr:hypothetical protein RR42_m3083 [Cupriavidus basilensis]
MVLQTVDYTGKPERAAFRRGFAGVSPRTARNTAPRRDPQPVAMCSRRPAGGKVLAVPAGRPRAWFRASLRLPRKPPPRPDGGAARPSLAHPLPDPQTTPWEL